MPVRVSLPSFYSHRYCQAVPRALFHSSSVYGVDAVPNHYEALNLQPSASAADIKRQFYALSKIHHPDHNPSDPNASSRFVRISEAYRTLSSVDKRTIYDRDLARNQPSLYPSRGRPTGSHSSAAASAHGPAGGRPASGLSRRRTPFRGPPPSFYTAGGYGQHTAKRAANAPGGLGTGASSAGSKTGSAESAQSTDTKTDQSDSGGFGWGQHQHWGADNDVPHWDREGHFRTQQGVEQAQHRSRNARRMPREVDSEDSRAGQILNFLAVAGVLSIIALIPSFTLRTKKSDGDK